LISFRPLLFSISFCFRRNQQKRNETKRNQQKRNETKRNQRNENEIKRNQHFVDFVSFRFVFVDFVSFRFVFVDFVSFRFVSFRFYFDSHFIGTRPYGCSEEFIQLLIYILPNHNWLQEVNEAAEMFGRLNFEFSRYDK
jgi:hypothetical protein